jgi:nicotinamidase-related amidase
MKPALLIIDMQKQFYNRGGLFAQSFNQAISYINTAIALFREKSLPIIVIEHQNAEDGLVPGAAGFPTHEDIKLQPTDERITKTYGNAFTKTSLAEMLRSQGVDTVIITGFCAEWCVLSTCRGAEDHDFLSILLRSALAGGVPERIRFVEEINQIISYEALKAVMG